MQPLYVSGTIVVNFAPQPQIHAYAAEFSARLAGSFHPFQVFPAPDNVADPNMPRLLTASVHGFTNLIVTQQAIQLSVNFSSDWQVDPARCHAYLAKKCSQIMHLTEVFGSHQLLFSGTDVAVQLPVQQSEDELLARLVRNLQGVVSTDRVADINLRKSTIEGDFYINSVVENYRLWAVRSNYLMPMPQRDVTQRGLQLRVDVNDRYAFNERAGYHTFPERLQEILSRNFAVTAEMIQNLREAL